MRLDEYAALDGLGLAELIWSSAISADEAAQAATAAISLLDPELNFMVAPIPSDQPRPTPSTDGLFAGVPSLIKDIGGAMADVPMEMGSLLAQGMRPAADSELGRRLVAAGLVFLGRSTTPELGGAFTTESRAAGLTRNPWDLSRSSGGSSGGAAVAVASGAVPIAHAGDSAGSIRIPAHCCGVFGLKPTRGRVPVGPNAGEINSGLTAGHVITRSVRDSAAALDAIAGPDSGYRYTAPRPRGSFRTAVDAQFAGLRLALCTASPLATHVDTELIAAADETARICEAMGNHVELIDLSFDAEEMIRNLAIIWPANITHSVRTIEAATGRVASPELLEGATWAMVCRGTTITADALLGALDWMNKFSRAMAARLDGFDALITPCMASTAPPLGLLSSDTQVDDLDAFFRKIFAQAAFTVQYNLTGQPAMSVPLHVAANGLPIGTQIVGRSGDEETLFALAGALEKALPWRDRHPLLSIFSASGGA